MENRLNYDNQRLKELQKVEVEILLAIKSVCDKHDIAWWLDSGSALGAMRHQGFIPWDDDIDIGMLREDYDLFCKVAPDELPDGYSFHSAHTDRNFACLFSKVYKDGTKFYTEETLSAGNEQGVFVDVLPYDYLCADEDEEAKRRNGLVKTQRLSYLWHSSKIVVPHKKGFLHHAERLACSLAHVLVKTFVSRDALIRKFDQLRYQAPKGEMVSSSAYAKDKSFDVGTFVPVVERPFEGIQFPCPHDAATYLRTVYGEWEKLPPVDQQKTHQPLVLEF